MPAVVLALALALAALFARDPSAREEHRFAAIDGLRAFLSPLVFVHHAAIWFYFTHNRAWMMPLPGLFLNCGGVSVALFFMITSFLFCTKLIESRAGSMDWLRLYVSRVLRLTPLYWCAAAVVLLIVGIETRFRLSVAEPDLWTQIQRWVLFTVNGAVDVNGLPATQLIIAGVTWTLPYEWYFYLLLPLVALAFGAWRAGESPIWLIVSVLTASSLGAWGLRLENLYPFAGGAVGALVASAPALRDQVKVRGANVLAPLCIYLAYVALPVGGTGLPSLALLTTGFVFIACGVNVFGLLTWKPLRALSSLSYGIYLWHGIVLFVVMRYVVGPARAAALSPAQHWLVALGCVPVVVGLAALTFRYVERPAMRAVPAVTKWLRAVVATDGAPSGVRANDTARSA